MSVCNVCENRCQYCKGDYQCSECENWQAEGRHGIPYKEAKTKFDKAYWESIDARYPNAVDDY